MTGGSSSRSFAEALLAWVQLHPLAALATLVVLYVTYKLAFKPVLFPSALRNLPRPKRASYLLGQRLVEAKGLTYTHPATRRERRGARSGRRDQALCAHARQCGLRLSRAVLAARRCTSPTQRRRGRCPRPTGALPR
ncbi:hypothetical protein L1887_54105 [Cichorium endivia]|nr:hypothetical protein L1887_54105 [Cichorium endivia]